MQTLARGLVRVLAVALSAVCMLDPTPVIAAEIICLEHYGDGGPIGREAAKKNWPSGFWPLADACLQALIRGTIEKGDYERYLAFYGRHHRALSGFLIQSPGGDAEEAIKIGRAVRKYLIYIGAPVYSALDKKTVLLTYKKKYETICEGPSCICASACALIWFGAVSRGGRVGLHRPRITDPRFSALPPDAASAVYRRALDEISRYLEEMETPRPLIDAMVATSSSEIGWVDAYDSDKDDDRLKHPPSFVEWVDASCGSFTSQEARIEGELATRLWQQKLPAHEEMLLRTLNDKRSNRLNCMSELVHTRRDALPVP